MPELHIITGSNGAGKSTFGLDYLPAHISANYPVFDGDKLFLEKRKELFPAITKSHKEARNLANEWLEEHMTKNGSKRGNASLFCPIVLTTFDFSVEVGDAHWANS